MSAESAAKAAAQRKIDIDPLTQYCYGSAARSIAANVLQLGFAAIPPPEIRRGVRELAIVLEQEQKAASRTR
jgi:DNA-binding transcriptional MocR family regulator